MNVLRQVILLVLLGAVGYGGYTYFTTGAVPWLGIETASNGGGGGGRPARQAPAVVTAEARVDRIENRVEAVGTTLAARSVDVAAGAEGTVREILFQAGDSVEEGAAMLRLDTEIARADLAEAQAELDEVRARLSRARTLRQNNTVSEASLDQLLAEEAVAVAEFERARKRLADRVVRAPFSGIVGFAKTEIGARVTDTTVIAGLDDLSEVQLQFTLPEALFGKVMPGQFVLAEAAAFEGQLFQGTVTSIDNRIDTVSRAFEVRAALPNPEGVLPAGMFMHLTIVLDAQTAIVIPEEAVIPLGGKTYVFVVADGAAERREVQLGQRMPGFVAVAAGVDAGERVVTDGQIRLRSGDAVRDLSAPADGGTSPVAAGTAS